LRAVASAGRRFGARLADRASRILTGMVQRLPIRSTDLRGAARLATDATAGLADLVEALHERIARIPGLSPKMLDGRTTGISGLVYKTIRGTTRVVGGSVEALLGLLAPVLDATEEGAAEREAVIAALNGVLGDHLAATGNPLATAMALRRGGRALTLKPAALAAALPDSGGAVLVMIHGLCMTDRQWLREGHDHGVALCRDLGLTRVDLLYNSGLLVSTNGQALAQQLERLTAAWPQPLQRLVLVGHSMGGLLARSAMHYGAVAGHRWRARVSDAVFLGTPHHGAPLERAGHWVDIVLGATPYAAPFARLGKVRSAGITDLRHGNLLHEDSRSARGADGRQPVPLPPDVRCFAVAASLGQEAGALKTRLVGDGLVPLDSALGRHRDPARILAFAPERQWVGYGIGHLGLLSRPEVCAQMVRWMSPRDPV
jgi:pimeloyl-ACP methyl ester carboxylesterase